MQRGRTELEALEQKHVHWQVLPGVSIKAAWSASKSEVNSDSSERTPDTWCYFFKTRRTDWLCNSVPSARLFYLPYTHGTKCTQPLLHEPVEQGGFRSSAGARAAAVARTAAPAEPRAWAAACPGSSQLGTSSPLAVPVLSLPQPGRPLGQRRFSRLQLLGAGPVTAQRRRRRA